MNYLGIVGTLAVIYLLYILARLSERLGSVERMKPLYRYYYVAVVFVLISLIAQLVTTKAQTNPQQAAGWLLSGWLPLALYYVPMSVGVTIGAVVSWQYWSWLITNQDK